MVVAGSGVEFIAGSRTGPASRNIRSALCIDAAAALAGIGTLCIRLSVTFVNI